MAFKLCMTVDLCMTSFYAHAHSDDPDLDFENVYKAHRSCLFVTGLRDNPDQ